MLHPLLLGLAASTLFAVGLLMMKSRGPALPEARGRQTLAAALAWLRDPMWLGGVTIQALGYALYLVALAHAPVSLLAVMMQGGIVLFILFAVVFLGEHASPAEWAGIAMVVLAMVAAALSLAPAGAESSLDTGALALVTVVVLIMGGMLSLSGRLRSSGAALALASGFAFGLAGLYAKALTCAFLADPGASLWIRAAANPYLYLTMVTNVGGLMMLQNSFHRARGIIAMPLSSAVSNLVPIAGGMIVFGERLPAEPLSAALRMAAFVMTIAGGVLVGGSRAA
jgi:uncharacterized membrane protein